MKTLHQQQDSHHNSDKKNKNVLNVSKNEKDFTNPKTKMSSLFAPFNHYGINNHSLIPFYKMSKRVAENENHSVDKAHEITNTMADAYIKQIEFSLDSAQILHKHFVDQVTSLYNFNQQFWFSMLYNGQ